MGLFSAMYTKSLTSVFRSFAWMSLKFWWHWRWFCIMRYVILYAFTEMMKSINLLQFYS